MNFPLFGTPARKPPLQWQTKRLLDSYRATSEDRAEILNVADLGTIFIVADGVGGRPNGAEAATLAVQTMETVTKNITRRQFSDSAFWKHALQTVDTTLSEAENSGETTLVVVSLTATKLVGASVGDSEAWWVHPSGQVRRLTGEQPRKPYLGNGGAFPAGFAVRTPATGTLLVASDGLFKYTSEEIIVGILTEAGKTISEAAIALRDVVRSSSGTLYDDFAVLLARPIAE